MSASVNSSLTEPVPSYLMFGFFSKWGAVSNDEVSSFGLLGALGGFKPSAVPEYSAWVFLLGSLKPLSTLLNKSSSVIVSL